MASSIDVRTKNGQIDKSIKVLHGYKSCLPNFCGLTIIGAEGVPTHTI